MKILLLDNVRKVGQKGDVVEVSDGYARNFLMKNGLGKPAIGANLKVIENLQKKKEEKKEAEKKALEDLYKKINKETFVLKQKASEKGHLFGGVHKKDIADLFGGNQNMVLLEKDIKEVGEFDLKIKLGELKAKITLIVEAE
jgi:large subunit ribosomal protein L9